MSDVEIAQTASGEQLPTESATPEPATLQQRAADNRHGTRIKVSVHRLDGGLEGGESDARVLTSEGFPIFTPPDSDRARWIPARDIKYVVLGSVDDSNLEPDPGDKSSARKAILRFRDGEWIAAYMDPGQASDGAGVAIQIRLTERQRIIPAVAASAALLEMQFVDAWTSTPDAARPLRRRSDIMEAAARQGRDLNRLADDFRDRLALIRDVGLTTGDTLAFSRAVRTHLDRFLAEDGIELSAPEKTTLADIILRAAVGYGPLDGLLHDRSVSEIMVNGPDEVFIERRGVLTKADVRFEDENQLLETIRRMVAARLPDGSRVNAIIRPAAIHGAALTIRKFKDAVLGMDDLTREGSLSPAMAEFLKAAVLGRMNVLVSGGTGSGKTTSLNVIARFIPHNQRVITIEDAAELQIDHPHVIALEHRPPNVEGKGELTIRQLLRNSLRMRPDRILVGEVRGAEALDMLQAMNTGHDGSMSTIHSNSARDALSRLETMVMMASIDIPFEAVRAQIASAVNLIVHQARMPDGRRKIAQIAEVVGYDSNVAILRDIFLLGMGSDLRLEYNATGYVPTSLDKAAFYGVQVDKDLFDPAKSRFVPAGSDSMMPVVKDPLMAGARGTENVVRQVVVVPFSSDRPGDSRPQQPSRTVQASDSAAAQTMASTPEMQEEMRKLIDAARSAVADLQAAAPAQTPAPAAPRPDYEPPPPVAYPRTQPPAPAQPAFELPPELTPSRGAPQGPTYAEDAGTASQALQAATAMARATTVLGNMAAAANSAFVGMLPITTTTGPGGIGATRRIQAVVESLVSRKGLNLRLAPAMTQAFEGAELKASDYAALSHVSKEVAGRELRQAVGANLLQLVKYPQGEAGFRADPALLKAVAEDPHRHQHRRSGRGGGRHLRRRGQRRRAGRRQSAGRTDPRLGGRPRAGRPGRGDEVRLSRPLQAEGLSGSLPSPRCDAGRGAVGDPGPADGRRLCRPRAGTPRHPHDARPRRNRLRRNAFRRRRARHRRLTTGRRGRVRGGEERLVGAQRTLRGAGHHTAGSVPRPACGGRRERGRQGAARRSRRERPAPGPARAGPAAEGARYGPAS